MKPIILIIILFLSIHKIVCANNSNSADSYLHLTNTILALESTKSNYQRDLFQQNQSLQKEYKIFINYLSLQISHYCTQIIKLYGEPSLNNLPCSKNEGAMIVDNYQTSEEKIESLDNEFMIAMGNFDEMLLVEDEKIAQINQTKDNNSGQSGAGGRQGNNTHNEFSNETHANNRQEQSNNARSKGSGNQVLKTQNKQRRRLNNIDDDIVARQLKEAAEKESDPELKEKLWNEYYKYKQKNIKKRQS